MNLSIGTRLGPYELLAPIGAGAMGEVYKARDTRLNRDVAIKVLPPIFARDPDRLARFEREGRAVAAINHPNILSVHDIGSADVVGADGSAARATYMITELLDGETLRARLAQGPLPQRKSVDVAAQIARGLAAAHDRGIVHRDLKPENIVLLRDGHVKVLDFGLAKTSTTVDDQTMAATEAGMVMGTVGYMAPEQVRGEPADARTDLFALGAVLYELADGRRPFARPTAAETMTAILNEDPPSLRPGLSPALDRIVRHALEKNPGERFQSARDFGFALQALSESLTTGAEPVQGAGSTPKRPVRRRELAAWGLAGFLALLATLVLWRGLGAGTGTSSQTPLIFTASLPSIDAKAYSPSLSPDGSKMAFIMGDRTGESIWVRSLNELRARPLKGTTNVRRGNLCWSPDGQSIGFLAGGKLKTVELATERVEELADAPSGYGAAWGPDGTILFSPGERTAIYRISAKGGRAKPVTTLDATKHEDAHRWPQFLPDGRHFVFMPWNTQNTIRSTQVSSLDGMAPKVLLEAASSVIVAGTHFLYVTDQPSHLMAQAFNPETMQLEGRASAVVTDDNVDFEWFSGYPGLTASSGTLIYTTGKFRLSQLTWFNRSGRALGTIGDADVHYDPTISPDGTTLAVEQRDSNHGSTDVWTVDLARDAFSRLTSTSGFESVATWSPDGRRIAFGSDQQPTPRLLVKNANGTGPEETLVEGRAFPTDWSPDDRYILYITQGGATQVDVWIYDVQARTSRPLLNSLFNETRARFSPDGKWIAYVSDESNDRQVYVRSFPDGGTKVQISTTGGDEPEWRRDGKEIFYLSADSTLMAATLRASGGRIGVEAAEPLFQTNLNPNRTIRGGYTTSVDGQRILVMAPLGDSSVSPLVAVLNWTAALSPK